MINRAEPRCRRAFTLTELLVVVAILSLLVATRLPALCRIKAPAQFSRCMNNCRQLATATLVYRSDNNDAYPFGTRFQSILQPTVWPMQLLAYLGANTNVQPAVFLCPGERSTTSLGALKLHYQANAMLVSSTSNRDTPIRGAQVRKPTIYWLFMEKGPSEMIDIKPGGLANPTLACWNSPPGCPQYRRHSGGWIAAAADGHGEWLQPPPYQPGRPPPSNFNELGDCSDGSNPASTWNDNPPPVRRIKLYCREHVAGFQ
jgi:prepilin-type N-terminal cleavage/methylation domain-containing protein